MCSIFCITEKDIDCPRVPRGPDMSEIKELPTGYMGFHRLAIMGLTAEGMQPFARGNDFLICNGEIYGFRPLKRSLEEKGYRFSSDSDCEILLPLYREYGVKMFKMLDAEFALVLYDGEQNKSHRYPPALFRLYGARRHRLCERA